MALASGAAAACADRLPSAVGLAVEGGVRTIPTMRSIMLAGALLCLSILPCAAQPTPSEIVLTLTPGPGQLEVTLEWSGGQPPFEVLRSAGPATVCLPESFLGITNDFIYFDSPPQGTFFYKIRSSFAVEPPEICNGSDDDCDGIIDEQAVDCSASGCEDCIDGACRSRCGPCDDCLNGACQTHCGSCEVCLNGACSPCSQAACQTCSGGACVSTCDESQCLGCNGSGACVSTCDTCETCTGGICFDACDRDQCLGCQSGSCRPFCDPICQVCTPQGCLDTCGPCERCAGGVCLSRCDPNACEECVDGMCVSGCSANPCEECVGGACQPCGS